TTRNRSEPRPVPLAGGPWHQRDAYVGRLVRLGYKVAICEQLEDPAQAKGLVGGGVPGVRKPRALFSAPVLGEGRSALFAAGTRDDTGMGFALAEASTGELRVGEAPLAEALAELGRQRVAEWLVPGDRVPPESLEGLIAGGGAVTRLPAEDFHSRSGSELRER